MLFSATEKSVKLWNQQQIHEEMEQPLPVNSSSLVSVTLLETEYDGLGSDLQDYDHKSDTNYKVSLQSKVWISNTFSITHFICEIIVGF